MDPLTAALLGVVQGLTEFLPVSSSAHLILARTFFGWTGGSDAVLQAFDVACHVGTLLAILVFFRADVAALVRAIPSALSPSPTREGRRLWLIAIGTVPVVIVGLLWGHAIEEHLRTPMAAAVALVVGGLAMLAADRLGPNRRGDDDVTIGAALAIGAAQAVAPIPGVSRSGATITMGRALGFERAAAARFSFLLSVPAILAAAGKEGLELRHLGLGASDAQVFVIGAGVSAVVGYFTIKYFIQFLMSHRLDGFAWYRVALALAAFAFLYSR